MLSTDSTRRKAHKFCFPLTCYINVAVDVSLRSSSVYILNVVNDARFHSSLKRTEFVNWPTYISVFRCKDLWSFVDAYCVICFPAQKTVRYLYSLFSRDVMYTAVSTKVVPQLKALKRTRQCRLVLWVERVWR